MDLGSEIALRLIAVGMILLACSNSGAEMHRHQYKNLVFESDSPLFFYQEAGEFGPSYYLNLLETDLETLLEERLKEGQTVRIQILTQNASDVVPVTGRNFGDQEWLVRITEADRTTELPGFRAPMLAGGGEELQDQWIKIVIGGLGYMVTSVVDHFWERTSAGGSNWLDEAMVTREAVKAIPKHGNFSYHRKRISAFLDRVLAPSCSQPLEKPGLRYSYFLQAHWNLQLVLRRYWTWYR